MKRPSGGAPLAGLMIGGANFVKQSGALLTGIMLPESNKVRHVCGPDVLNYQLVADCREVRA